MSVSAAGAFLLPSPAELQNLFLWKYGRLDEVGWAPRRRFRFAYYHPADVYEAFVARLVTPGCEWIDIGGGHSIFPENPRLSHHLAARSGHVVAVDPSENVHDNSYVHERVQCRIEEYEPGRQFDLATFRMVVEHVDQPEKVVRAVRRLLRPGGTVVLLTVNARSPITLISRLTPHSWHAPIKRLFWGGEDKDTFPVQYKMNSRDVLRRLFESHGFEEVTFAHLDDLSTWAAFKSFGYLELLAWRMLRALGCAYPENCLLGAYRKVA